MTILHPIIVGTVSDAGLPLDVGALVTYHGRRRGHEYSVFYVAAIDADDVHIRYDLFDRDYPSVAWLEGVSRQHITPTGRVVALCPDCGHEAGRRPSWSQVDVCDAHPVCGCMQHPARAEN